MPGFGPPDAGRRNLVANSRKAEVSQIHAVYREITRIVLSAWTKKKRLRRAEPPRHIDDASLT
jgi:hypothetical protein